jgi:hypothetical protein
MWLPDDPFFEHRPSFLEPQTPPSAGPQAGTLYCVEVPGEYLPLMTGALAQLLQASAWNTTDPTVLATTRGYITTLLALIGNAGQCMQAGTQSVTITATNAVGTHAITFPVAFASAPVVVGIESTGQYIASIDPTTITTTGFTAKITARFAVLVDSSATVAWMARIP